MATHSLEFCQAYWKIALEDYLECMCDNVSLSEEQKDLIVDKLLDDDEMWGAIESAFDYYIGHIDILK